MQRSYGSGIWIWLASAVLALVGAAGTASAAPFSFGVISDSQDTIGTGINSVSTNIVAAVNQQFIARGVDFVVQPGDLCDNGSVAGETTRLAANANLTAAGIPFYGLRGNHDDNSAAQAYFQTNYIPTSSSTVQVQVAPDNTSYAITYKNTTLVMLDILTADSTGAMDTATTWMNGVLGQNNHTQAFVFQHKDLIGQNHHDNAFESDGASQDENPTEQNNFFQALATHNVRYDISGHDHMNHRSIVTSPNGQYQVEQIISQSDSTKYYTPATPSDSRETCISDQQNMIGYYIYTVNGPEVTGEYWATPPAGNGDIPANPVWTLQDTFGYSLNGKQFTIARGGSYSVVSDAIAAGGGFRGTSMRLAGTNSVTATTASPTARAEVDDLNTGWTATGAGMASDILTLWGMNNSLGSPTTDPYTLTMSYAPGATGLAIEHQNADGSWTLLPTTVNGDGTVSASGLTFDGNFAVVPEPVSMTFLAFGGVALMLRRKRQ